MIVKLDLKTELKKRIEKYQFEVGILSEKPRREPKLDDETLGYYAGGPVRKLGPTRSEQSNSEVFLDVQERLGIDLLQDPFKSSANSNIVRFSNEFLKYCFGKSSDKRVENLLQAIVRNPILRGDYGGNTGITADAKGFDRLLFDTGQLFKSIKARILK